MTEIQTPEGMITVDDFAKRKGLDPKKVINMIKDGFYIGRVVGDQWFVDPAELSDTNSATKNQRATTYQSDYGVARKVSIFISFLGWVVFAVGVLAAFAGLVGELRSPYGNNISIGILLSGIGIAVSGLFLIAAGQVTRATVDNADHTREILRFLRAKT